MAKMVPAGIGEETSSYAEKVLFEKLRDLENTDEWIVLHSVGIAKHPSQPQGETDFVVIIPNSGVFILEVKGGNISYNDGCWFSENRSGKYEIKDPVNEASNAMAALIDFVKNSNINGPGEHLERMNFGFGVVFPDTDFHGKVSLPNLADEQVFDINDMKQISAYFERLADYWKNLPGKSLKIPNLKETEKIAKILRPNFNTRASLLNQIRNLEEKTITLTDRQSDIFEGLLDNDRCIVKGGAGTGKTILALNYVKNQAKQDLKIAMFCFNKQLADYLSTATEDNVVCNSFTEYMLETVKEKMPDFDLPEKADFKEFYNSTLPNTFFDVFTDNNMPKFDCLVIDEAQDLIKEDYLEILDTILEGGLKKGNWYFFMDADRQNIYNSGFNNKDLFSMLESRDVSFTKFTLTENCRNSLAIIEKMDEFFGTTTKHLQRDEIVPDVSIRVYDKQNEERKIIEQVINKLIEEDVPLEDVVILSPLKLENSVVSTITKFDITNDPKLRKEKILYSTIHAFKGLESSVVILVDFENAYIQKDLLYIGMSRAKNVLFLIIKNEANRQLLKSRGDEDNE